MLNIVETEAFRAVLAPFGHITWTGLLGEGWTFDWPQTAAWMGRPTGADLVRFQMIYDVLLVIVATVGFLWAVRRWRAYRIDGSRAAPAQADG